MMYFDKTLPAIVVSVLLLFSLNSCSDSGTGADTDDQTATISGSVENEASKVGAAKSQNAQAASVVSAARVRSNGSIEIIEGTETETDASGRFTVEVDANTVNRVVIVAEGSDEQKMGFVASEIENNNSYTIKPLNSESTAETSVFAEVFARGETNIVQKSDIELLVSSEAAADINSSSSAAAEIAAALSQSAEARADFFTEFSSQSNLETALELMAEAQAQYEQALDASGSSSGETEFDTYINAVVDAYSEAGLEISNVAKMLHAQPEIIKGSATSVSAEVKNSMRASSSLMASVAIDKAVQAHAEASNTSQATISAIVDAGAKLQTSIKNSSGVSAEISGAFSTYHSEVRSAFETEGSVEATIIVAVDTEINASGGAKLEFENALNSILSLGSVTDVYLNFSSNTRSSVEAQSELIGTVDVESITELVVLINLFS